MKLSSYPASPLLVRDFHYRTLCWQKFSTEEFRNLHVEKKHFPRRDEMKLRRNQMKLRRNYFSPTWRMTNSSVEIFDFLRGGWNFFARGLSFPVWSMIFESDRSSRDSDFLAVQVALFNTKGLYSSKVIRMFALQFKIEKGYSRLTCGRVWIHW